VGRNESVSSSRTTAGAEESPLCTAFKFFCTFFGLVNIPGNN
jgi:hypothetical protein